MSTKVFTLNKAVSMKLKTKLFIVMATVFSLFITVIWLYSESLSNKINEEWGEKFVRKQIIFDKYRTLLPIMREIELVQQLSRERTIIDMALYEHDPKRLEEGIETLERYRVQFQDQSYFAAFVKSQNYYFNDNLNQFATQQLRYQLSPTQTKDRWFYETISIRDTCQINVNKDNTLGVTKVWINYVLRDNNKIIGVIGTGFDFDQFLKESVGIEQEGIKNFFITKNLSIQLAKDTRMIDYSSITKKDGTHKTIDMFLKNKSDIERVKEAMHAVESSLNPNSVKTLWVTVEGKKQLLGIAYQREVGWFNLTLFDADELTLISNVNIFIILSFLFLIAFFVVGFMFNTLVLAPINNLKQMMSDVTKGEYDINLPIVGSGEIAELSEQFKQMVEVVHHTNRELENKIQERTAKLRESETKFRALALYDSLTNLPNRRLLLDRLVQAQATSNRNSCYGAVLFMDLDNFKPLNDTYGHTVGDLLLIEVAHRIKICVRESDTVARFGGDEFIILLNELNNDKNESIIQASAVAEKIRSTLAQPYFLKVSTEGIDEKIVEHHCTTSIGIALFFAHEATQDDIIKWADSAMYEAKESGRNQICFHLDKPSST
ncbi:MAG: diguanylate cyclase [Sulfuricurvum sp.]|nr:diguanylate cyclase [Sulfuricurvum sp.]